MPQIKGKWWVALTKNGPIIKISTDLGFFYIKTTQKKYQSDLKDFLFFVYTSIYVVEFS